MRPIDAKVIEDFDGAKLKITRVNGPLDTDAAYIRGYNAGMQLIVNEAKKAPTITPEALRPVSRWKKTESGYSCAACEMDAPSDACGFTVLSRYCLNCGARMENIKAALKVKSASTSLHGGWKNAKTEPPPPNTNVEVYCKALGVTVGYHRPLMDEWLTDDHRTLRNVTHWRPIPPPPPEAEP